MTGHHHHVRIAVATLNQTVGDWGGNRERLAQACEAARSAGAALLALPELCIPGYSLADRVWMEGTLPRSWATLEALLPHTRGLATMFGLPFAFEGALYDAMVVVIDGVPVGIVPKENLATGDVEYESRWYSPWQRGRVVQAPCPDGRVLPMGSLVFEAPGLGRFAVEVCEDGWKGNRPGSAAALAGAAVLINASASWFTLGKQARRRRMVTDLSRQDLCAYAYTSLHGCDATRVVFDGGAMIAERGRMHVEAPRYPFSRDVVLASAVVDLHAIHTARHKQGSWREQVTWAAQGHLGPQPTVVHAKLSADTHLPAAEAEPGEAWWSPTSAPAVDPSLSWVVERGFMRGPLTHEDVHFLELELTLALGLREYLQKSGIGGSTVALSGGRDSAMCALLAARAVAWSNPELRGADLKDAVRAQLTTAYLATENSGEATRSAAAAVAADLGAEHLQVNLDDAVHTHHRLAGDLLGITLDWKEPTHDLALQNVQARLRGSLIWMVANLRGHLLLTTSNKSEAAVGYCTMDGDTSGGLAPIADVPKSMINDYLAWAATTWSLPSLQQVLAEPATAELRPGSTQTDEGDLMPYAILDRLIWHFACEGQEPVTLFHALWPSLRDHYAGDARAFATHIRRFVSMFCRSQWKRERYAIGLRVTAFDLDPRSGFRFPPVQDAFRQELAELDALVASMMSPAASA